MDRHGSLWAWNVLNCVRTALPCLSLYCGDATVLSYRVIFWAFSEVRSNAYIWQFQCNLRMLMRMNIKHLTHIVAVAERGNFARAAEQLNLSQPALSRSIQAAEAEL
jgi:Bacterial regulatory helix-turn-helix protein, lysR family